MPDQDCAVAIVGMDATFPGAADLDQFWSNVVEAVDAVEEAPSARLDPLYYDPASAGVDRFYCRRGGFVDGVASFDPVAFGVMPATVGSAEPDQLLALAVAARALADAGGEAKLERRERTAVIVGRGSYMTPGLARLDQRVRTSEQLVACVRSLVPAASEEQLVAVKEAFVGRLGPDHSEAAIDLVPNLAASRIANRLDLGGPAYTVDAACASALIAVDHGVRELVEGRCDLVLAGGVHLCHDVTIWSVFTQLGALSRSGEIRPFDRRADGLLIGEGAGMVVLERLADAERSGSRIYAVIRGTGVSSDGRSASLMKPDVDGQSLSIKRAWDLAQRPPSAIGLLEAHGTATPTGDMAELETVRRSFGERQSGQPTAVIGSVKSMIGHAMPAASAAGLVKATLALYHGVRPPTLHCEEPHPLLESTIFEPLSATEPWPRTEGPRLAGVNAFGFGGINAHVVLEEHGTSVARPSGSSRRRERAAPHQRDASKDTGPDQLVLLSAPSRDQLLEQIDRIENNGASPVSGSAPAPEGGPVRLAMFNPTPKRLGLARKIVGRGSPWRGRNDVWFTTDGLVACGGKVAFVFPGVEPVFEPRIDDVARHFRLPRPRVVDSDSAASDLEGLGHAIVGVGRLLHAALVELGLRADIVAGQSIGEWSGMIATEMIPGDDVDGFIATLQPGSLEVPGVVFAALGCNVRLAEELAAGYDGVVVSHDNCPRQTIVCGPEVSVDRLLEELRGRRIMGQLLPFRSGFHSTMFRPFLEPFRQALARLPLQPPQVPLWSATTCGVYPDEPSSIRTLAVAHLTERVRFRELTMSMHDAGARVFVQVGVGSLPGFVEDTLEDRPFLSVPSNTARRSGLEQLRRVLAAAWVEGVKGLRFDRLDPAIRSARPAKVVQGQPLSLGSPLVRLPRMPDLLPSRSGDDVDVPSATALAHQQDWSSAGTASNELRVLLADVTSAATDVVAALAGGSRRDRSGGADGDPVKRPPLPPSSTRQLRLSVETVPSLLDHCFYRQPPGWPSIADRFPVVPMTMLVDLMIDEARRLLPGLYPVAVEDARALQWLAVAPPVEVTLRARVVEPSVDDKAEVSSATQERRMGADERRVQVSIEGYGRATIVMASRYPDRPAPACPPVDDPRPSPVDAADLYEDRWLFHGPAYRGVVGLGPIGEDGIDGVIETGDAPGALLDNAGQLMGFWMMISAETDRLALPTSIGRISFYGPPPAVGARFDVAVRVRSLTEEKIRTDMELVQDGQLWARIDSWEDRRFESDGRVWPVLIYPEHSLLAEIRPAGWVLVTEHWRTSASRELMMRRYLGEAEREEYIRQNPRAQRLWLLGRIAAKDAVRHWLFEHGLAACHPVEVSVTNDQSGRPSVSGPFDVDLRVSIAHTQWVAVAQVTEGAPVGIDVERLEDRSSGFARVAFSNEDLAVIADGSGETERGEWLTRGWAAKEAIGKAAGTGLRGRPKDLRVTELKGTRLCVNGMWVDTAREGDAVVAWTVGHE